VIDTARLPPDLPHTRVELDLADAQRRAGTVLPRTHATEHRADPAAQLSRAERLDDVVVRARLEPEHCVRLAVERREHDQRHAVAPPPQLTTDRVAVRAAGAERDVEQDDVEVLGARPVDRGAAVRDRQDPVALALEGLPQRLA
jgi:hypothetical protein